MTITDNQPSRINGDVNFVAGMVKENVGYALGNMTMEADGAALRQKGNAEVLAAKGEKQVESVGDRVHGLKDEVVGKVTGDESQRMGGKTEQTKGSWKSELNK